MDFATDTVITGLWWIPAREERFHGSLHYQKSDGLVLEINGAFNGKSDLMGLVPLSESVIHGVDENRNCYTLFNARGVTYGSFEFYRSRFEPELVLMNSRGYHFDEQAFKIKGFRFSTNFFLPFFYRFINVPDDPTLHHGSLQMKLEETADIELGDFDRFNIRIYFSYDCGFRDRDLKNDFYMSQDVFLWVDFNDLHTRLAEIIPEAHFLKDFFSFFCYRQVSFRHFHLITSIKGGSNSEDIIFECLFAERSTRIGEQVRIYHVLLPYTEFGEDHLQKALGNWYANRNFISGGLSLYMAVAYLRLTLPVHAFLNLVFAIETFHKNFYPCVSKLKPRIKELLDSGQDMLKDYISNPTDFCNKVVQQRNHLAHDHTGLAPIQDSEYLYYIAVLKMLFEISFLRKLELPDQALNLMLSRNFMYKYFRTNH